MQSLADRRLRLGVHGREIKRTADENSHVPLVTVLDRFHPQEHRRANHRDQGENRAVFVATQLGRANCQRHRQTAEQQHNRIQAAQDFVQIDVGLFEDFGMVIAVQRVGHEQAAEKQDFGDQKYPNSQLAGVKLLLGRIKVVGNELAVIMIVIIVSE